MLLSRHKLSPPIRRWGYKKSPSWCLVFLRKLTVSKGLFFCNFFQPLQQHFKYQKWLYINVHTAKTARKNKMTLFLLVSRIERLSSQNPNKTAWKFKFPCGFFLWLFVSTFGFCFQVSSSGGKWIYSLFIPQPNWFPSLCPLTTRERTHRAKFTLWVTRSSLFKGPLEIQSGFTA